MISEPYELTISIPVRQFTAEQIENIRTFVSRNDALLLTGLPAVSTEIIVDDDHISFPWFVQTGPAVDQANFISNILVTCKASAPSPSQLGVVKVPV